MTTFSLDDDAETFSNPILASSFGVSVDAGCGLFLSRLNTYDMVLARGVRRSRRVEDRLDAEGSDMIRNCCDRCTRFRQIYGTLW